MSVVAVSSPVTAAYLQALKDIGDFPIGLAAAPPKPTPTPATFFPYAVLYVGTTLMQGTYVDPHEDGLYRLQVTSFGKTPQSAEHLRDLVRPVLLDVSIDIDGFAVVWTELTNSQPIFRDDDVKPAIFSAVDVVNALITPANSGS